MKILVLNSGSSSIKFSLFDMKSWSVLASGLIEKIGEARGLPDHAAGLKQVIDSLKKSGALNDPGELFGIGHRVVHGGETFREATRIDAKVIAAIRALIPLAPLHNGPNLQGIEVAQRIFSSVPQVAVFDTAFHQTLPPLAF